jgi:hypothetical protein
MTTSSTAPPAAAAIRVGERNTLAMTDGSLTAVEPLAQVSGDAGRAAPSKLAGAPKPSPTPGTLELVLLTAVAPLFASPGTTGIGGLAAGGWCAGDGRGMTPGNGVDVGGAASPRLSSGGFVVVVAFVMIVVASSLGPLSLTSLVSKVPADDGLV